MSNLLKRVLSMAVALIMVFSLIPVTSLAAEETTVVFNLGTDVETTTHADGSSKTSYSEEVNGYTLALTATQQFYTGANDATGNACIKLGSSSKVGGFNFTVPADVSKVIISVAGYKGNTAKVSVNATEHTITTLSNNGAYTDITVDTSSTKAVSFTTVSGGVRAMVNAITYVVAASDCAHSYTAEVTTAATCTTAGVMTYTCSLCNESSYTEEIVALGHVDADGDYACDNCDATIYSKIDTLVVGSTVVLVAESASKELQSVDGIGNGVSYTSLPNGAMPLTVETGYTVGTYAFKNGDNYLSWTSENSLETSATLNANSSWTVSFDEEGNAVILNAADGERKLRWNASNPRFACYTSEQTAVQLYAYGEVEAVECDHQWKDATCTTPKACPLCNATEGEALGHTYGDPTYEGYYEVVVCSVCGEEEKTYIQPEADAELTIPEAAELAVYAGNNYTEDKYYVVGEITEIANTQYGNLYIEDADGNELYIYGVYDGEYGADGTNRFDAMDPQPVVGDTITAYGVLGTYNNVAQMKNAWVTIHEEECEHTGEKEYQDNNDSATHKVICADCDEVLVEEEEHIYDENGVCVCTAVKEGSAGAPISLMPMAFDADGNYTVTVPAGETVYYAVYNAAGANISVNDVFAVTVGARGGNFSITNEGEEDASYVINLSYPVGHANNPEEVIPGYYDAEVEEGSNGYYYVYKAEAAGTIDLWITELTDVTAGDLIVTNGNAQRSLSADGVADWMGDLILSMDVAAGDEVIIQALTVDPEVFWNTPAGTVGWAFNFTYPLGSQNNPIQLGETGDTDLVWNEDYSEATYSVTVPEGETYYLALATNCCGMLMSDNGGEAVVMNQNHMMGCNFTLAAGEHKLVFTYPLGSDANPDTLVIGDNSCAPNGGYYTYKWVATATGELTITMASDVWEYSITNQTASVATDTHWSDDETPVASDKISVVKGDEVVVVVSGGEELKFTAAFEKTSVAQIGETPYDTVAEALAAAKSGETVALTADAEENYVIVTPGVTLDLGAHTLTANYVIGLQDSCITGTTISADGQTGAKLKVAKNNVSLAAKIAMSGNYAILPVWNGDHYVFSLFYASAPEQITVSNEGDKVSLSFKHQASNYVQECLKNGSSAYGVSVIVRAEWTIDGANLSQEFVYTDTMVGNVSKDNKMAYSAEMSGCTSKEDLTISIMIVTDAGATYLAKTYSEIN